MGRYCNSCTFPILPHDALCAHCEAVLLDRPAAEAAQKRWDELGDGARREFQAEYDLTVEEWYRSHKFYSRKAPIKHMLAGAVVFGVAGILSGWLAIAYFLAGLLGGLSLSRRKGGIFLGVVVGAVVFAVVLGVRTLMALILPVDAATLIFHAAMTQYSDRFVGLLCPAGGGLLGYLIEQEYETHG